MKRPAPQTLLDIVVDPREAALITEDFQPRTDQELALALASPRWRLFSGILYRILIKGEEDEPATSSPFIPNVNQVELYERLHNRNLVLKARQLGITTFMSILLLDHCLFVREQRAGIIAHTLTDAEAIFEDKVKFAYDNLPPDLLAAFPTKNNSADTLRFAHNASAIRVATSMRGGTMHRLHVSEMGKIAKESVKKAREIVTGSLQAVPIDGIATIESTAEGQDGEFYNIATRAQAIHELGRPLSKAEFRFHFFPWFTEPKYRMDPASVTVEEADHVYFDKIERSQGVTIDDWQRAFYVSKRETDFSGDQEKMWQEWPSSPEECWQKSTEGTFYARELSAARKTGRIGTIPHISRIPVHTWWDIGASDGTAVWLHQYIGGQHRLIGFIEGWDEPYDYFVRKLRETGYVFGSMNLPHDAKQRRQMARTIGSPLTILQELAPDWSWQIVPQIDDFQHGINLTRQLWPQLWFDAEACKAGLTHLALYHKKFNTRTGTFSPDPEKLDGHSEAADALRQIAQGWHPGRGAVPPSPSSTAARSRQRSARTA